MTDYLGIKHQTRDESQWVKSVNSKGKKSTYVSLFKLKDIKCQRHYRVLKCVKMLLIGENFSY